MRETNEAYILKYIEENERREMTIYMILCVFLH